MTIHTAQPHPAVDLTRQAKTVAAEHGWIVLATSEEAFRMNPPGEHSLLVIGEDLAEPSLLLVRDDTDRPQTLRQECLARRQARSEHIVGVLETLPQRRVRGRTIASALLQHSPSGTLRMLLEERPGLALGEAATILIGAARALVELHAAGWAGAPPTTDAIAFRADGCPVLTRLDGVRSYSEAGGRSDSATFHAFARSVCLAVPRGEGAPLFAAVEGALCHPGMHRVVAAVLATAEPTAVGVPAPATPRIGGEGGTRRSGRRTAAARTGTARARSDPDGSAVRGGLYTLERVLNALEDRPLARLGRAAWSWLRARPRLVAVAAVPIVVTVLFLLAIPSPESEAFVSSSAPAGSVTIGQMSFSAGAESSSPTVVALAEGRPGLVEIEPAPLLVNWSEAGRRSAGGVTR